MKGLVEYLGGLAGSVAGFFLGFAAYYVLRELDIGINWGGDHSGVVLGFNIGVPIGGTAGIVLVSRMVFKSRCWHALGISASLIMGFIGVRLCIFLGSELGLREKVLAGVAHPMGGFLVELIL